MKTKTLINAFTILGLVLQIGNYTLINAMNDDEYVGENAFTPSHTEHYIEYSHPGIKRAADATLIQPSPQEFFTAVQHNNKKVVRYLYNCSLNVNVQNPMGWTPLHYAVILNNFGMVKFLVQKCHALTDLPDKMGLTPRYIAIQNHNQQIADFLLMNKPFTAKWPRNKLEAHLRRNSL